MTFTDAAALVLRLAGKPLHYKEITDVAVDRNLLSHVGKSPEVTMGARLAALVKKGDKESPLVRVKPGVFALAEWSEQQIERGLGERTPALELIARREAAGELVDIVASSARPGADGAEDDEEAALPDAKEQELAALADAASDIFEAEDDDDEPIFGSLDEPEPARAPAVEADDRDAGARKRRRRRGKKRERDESDDGLPTYTVSDAPAGLLDEASDDAADDSDDDDEPDSEEAESARDGVEARDGSEARDGWSDRGDRGRGERDRGDRGERDRGDRGDRGERDRGDRDRGDRGERDRGDRDRGDRERGDRDRDRGDRDRDRGDRDRGDRGERLDDLGADGLADALHDLLGDFDRKGGPVPAQKVAEAAIRRRRASGDAQQLGSALLAAARLDNARRLARLERPRFRLGGGKLARTSWALDGDLGRADRELFDALDRYKAVLRKQLARRIAELSQRALPDLVQALLERMGTTQLRPIKRAGVPGHEAHLQGIRTSELGDEPVAVVIRKDGREVGRERVIELRGALHHYGPARVGVLVTGGQVLSGAREEAAAPGAAPVLLLDGAALAQLCLQHGVGVSDIVFRVPVPDLDLLDAARG